MYNKYFLRNCRSDCGGTAGESEQLARGTRWVEMVGGAAQLSVGGGAGDQVGGWAVLYCTAPYCTVMHCAVLHCTAGGGRGGGRGHRQDRGHQQRRQRQDVEISGTGERGNL